LDWVGLGWVGVGWVFRPLSPRGFPYCQFLLSVFGFFFIIRKKYLLCNFAFIHPFPFLLIFALTSELQSFSLLCYHHTRTFFLVSVSEDG